MDASVGSRGAWSPRTAHQLPVGPAPTASPILSSFNRPELAEVFPLVLKTHLFQNHTIVSSLHNHQGSRSVSFHHGRLHLSRLPTAQAPARRHGDPLPVNMGTLCPSTWGPSARPRQQRGRGAHCWLRSHPAHGGRLTRDSGCHLAPAHAPRLSQTLTGSPPRRLLSFIVRNIPFSICWG